MAAKNKTSQGQATAPSPSPPTIGQRVRRWTLIVLASIPAGVLFAAVVIAYSHTPQLRWIGFAFYTAILFGEVIRQYRRRWRLAFFWLTLVAILTVHTVVFAFGFRHIDTIRAAEIGVLSMLEFGGVVWCLQVLGF